jgi:membrane-bound lytic murein transglycosylase A
LALLAILCQATALLLQGCQAPGRAPPPVTGTVTLARYERVAVAALPQLDDDELLAAWPAWRQSCAAWAHRQASQPAAGPAAATGPGARWAQACAATETASTASGAPALRTMLEGDFDAWRIVAEEHRDNAAGSVLQRRSSGLMTGYFEPLLSGSRAFGAPFVYPIYGVPADLLTIDLSDLVPELRGRRIRGRLVDTPQGRRVVPYWPRADIERKLGASGAELLWVDDRLAAFLVQVQGSGRVQLADGTVVRIAYADTNGQPYRSIGRWLVDHGELSLEAATLPAIQAWADAHPERLDELLDADPSFVFFREVALGDPAAGPAGALGVPLSADHSVAVDARFVPLGAPLVISASPRRQVLETHATGAGAIDTTDQRRREDAIDDVETGAAATHLVMAQDTGGAIRGPLRFDLFRGTGAGAGAAAGVQRDAARAWLLLPKGIRPEELLGLAATNGG